MRINQEQKSVDIERRDINYILPAYVRSYLFYARNEDPEKIVLPMFRSVPHPTKPGVEIPIEYIPDDSPVATEIAEDGKDIPEATPDIEAEADKKEEDYNVLKARIAELEEEVAKGKDDTPPLPLIDPANPPDIGEHISPAKAAFAKATEEPESAIAGVSENQPTPERLAAAKAPDVVLPPGTSSDYGGSRDKRDQKRVAKDIAPEKDIKEDEEVEIDKITDIPEPNKEK